MRPALALLALCALPGAALAAPPGSAICREVTIQAADTAPTRCHGRGFTAHVAVHEYGDELLVGSQGGPVVCTHAGRVVMSAGAGEEIAIRMPTIRAWTCHKGAP